MLALRTTEPAILSVYFMVRTSLTEEQEKALVLWLNSFWGISTVFTFVEITEGAFTRLNIARMGNAVKCLANTFDKCANTYFGKLTEQFERGYRCLSQK